MVNKRKKGKVRSRVDKRKVEQNGEQPSENQFIKRLEERTQELLKAARAVTGDPEEDYDETRTGPGWALSIAAHDHMLAYFSAQAGEPLLLVTCDCGRFIGLMISDIAIQCKYCSYVGKTELMERQPRLGN